MKLSSNQHTLFSFFVGCLYRKGPALSLNVQDYWSGDSACGPSSKNHKSSCCENIDNENIFFYKLFSPLTDNWQDKQYEPRAW